MRYFFLWLLLVLSFLFDNVFFFFKGNQQNAVSIIETDISVDFAIALDEEHRMKVEEERRKEQAELKKVQKISELSLAAKRRKVCYRHEIIIYIIIYKSFSCLSF